MGVPVFKIIRTIGRWRLDTAQYRAEHVSSLISARLWRDGVRTKANLLLVRRRALRAGVGRFSDIRIINSFGRRLIDIAGRVVTLGGTVLEEALPFIGVFAEW